MSILHIVVKEVGFILLRAISDHAGGFKRYPAFLPVIIYAKNFLDALHFCFDDSGATFHTVKTPPPKKKIKKKIKRERGVLKGVRIQPGQPTPRGFPQAIFLYLKLVCLVSPLPIGRVNDSRQLKNRGAA